MKMTKHNFEPDTLELVEQVKDRLKGVISEEMYEDTALIIRFLKARNYDLKAAENMLRNHINWRKENKVDSIISWYIPHEVAGKYIPFSPIGFDKSGAPILYFDFGNWDVRGLIKSVSISEMSNFFVTCLEKDVQTLKEQFKKTNKTIEQWVYIFNFENFSLYTATNKQTLEAIGKLVSLYEANYPERLKESFVINTSWYFQIGYSVIKTLITPQTQKKIKIFGTDGWKDGLLDKIDADILPAFLGGKRTDPDGNPKCNTILKHGAMVPNHYFLANSKNTFKNQKGVKKISVHRFSKEQIDIHVRHPKSLIEWEFQTKSKDIQFSLLFKENPQSLVEAKEVIPMQTFDASESSESGIYKCSKSGTYSLMFDNTHSWIYQKEVYYRIQVSKAK